MRDRLGVFPDGELDDQQDQQHQQRDGDDDLSAARAPVAARPAAFRPAGTGAFRRPPLRPADGRREGPHPRLSPLALARTLVTMIAMAAIASATKSAVT